MADLSDDYFSRDEQHRYEDAAEPPSASAGQSEGHAEDRRKVELVVSDRVSFRGLVPNRLFDGPDHLRLAGSSGRRGLLRRNGRDFRSPLALAVGAKGYHDESTGVYTVR